jgi:hypothetical protein
MLGDILASVPARLQAALYDAFSIELLYNTDMHQVTIWATITATTPRALAAIINDSEDPASAATASTPVSDLPQHPGAPRSRHDPGKRVAGRGQSAARSQAAGSCRSQPDVRNRNSA